VQFHTLTSNKQTSEKKQFKIPNFKPDQMLKINTSKALKYSHQLQG
jgi:hypothetical protein